MHIGGVFTVVVSVEDHISSNSSHDNNDDCNDCKYLFIQGFDTSVFE